MTEKARRLMDPDQTDVSIDDEIAEQMALGSPREALHLLMRCVADRGRRVVGATSGGTGAMDVPRLYLKLASCFAMLGMEPDALDWCAEGEKLGRARRDSALGFQFRALRLWLLVDGGRIAPVADLAANLLRMVPVSDDGRAQVIAALILTAARTGDFASAERFAKASAPLQNRRGLGSVLLDLVIADMRFREVLTDLPQFQGSLAKRSLHGSQAQSPALLVDRVTTAGRRFGEIASTAQDWPLLNEFACASQTAALLLAEQLRGKKPPLAQLERYVAKLSSRGLTPVLKHARFLLAVLVLHQGRPATAEAWLTNGAPVARVIDKADPDELLLLAFARAESLDFVHAYRLYRGYVALVSEQTAQCSGLSSMLTDRMADAGRSAERSIGLGRPAGWLESSHHNFQPRPMDRFVREASLVAPGTTPHIALMLERTAAAVREMVENDLSRPLLVRDIVAALGISRRTLEIRVRRASGTSVKRYVASIRLQHARHLILAHGALSSEGLRRIALQVGFPTYRTFSSAYRRSFGAIPMRTRGPLHVQNGR